MRTKSLVLKCKETPSKIAAQKWGIILRKIAWEDVGWIHVDDVWYSGGKFVW